MRKIILTTLVTLIIFSVRAQSGKEPNRYTDSLDAIVQNGPGDSAKVAAALLLSYHWAAWDIGKAQDYIEIAKAKGAAKIPYLNALSIWYQGIIYYVREELDSCAAAFMKANEALKPFNTKEALSFRSQAWHNYGIVLQTKGDEEGFARVMIDESIPLAQQAKDTGYLGKNYLDLAIVFKNTKQYDKAIIYLKDAISTLAQYRKRLDLINAYTTLAETYTMAMQYDHAKPMLDSALAWLTRKPNEYLMVEYHTAESIYYIAVKEYTRALASIEKGVAIAKAQDRKYDEQRLLMEKFHALYSMKEYRQAKDVLMHLSMQPQFMQLFSNRLELFSGLAETNAALGNMKEAYDYSLRYSKLSDSVNESRLKDQINALEVKYGNAEKQKKIEVLKAENERSSLSARNTMLMIWFLGSVCLLLLVVAVLTLLYIRNNKKLARQKDLNHQQQLKEIEQQQQIQVGHALLQGEERERRRVAGDLHDGLGGLLAGVKMNLTGMAAADQHRDLNRVVDQLDHSISELRRIARNMMPEALLKFGLETALREACENLITDKVNIHFQSYGISKDIPHEKQLTIYRIVQELLTNAIKHSSANEILLQCSQNDDTFFVTIEDNGRGFDTGAVREVKGIGLGNVKNRVEYLAGKLEISSAINEGTSINIELNVA